MKAKVCILTTDHSALDDRIFYKEAQGLHKAGYEVTLIAPLNQDGFLTDMGKKHIARNETVIDGIKILGFKIGKHSLFNLPKTWTLSQWLRLHNNSNLNYRQNDPFSDIINKGIQINADIYHCHEIWSLYSGKKIIHALKKNGKNPKLIYDVHEFWSEKRSKKLRDMAWSKAIRQFEKKSLIHIDYVIAVNQIIRGYILNIKRNIKTEVLYNCSILKKSENLDQKSDNEKIIICHEGNLTFDRGLDKILKVMKILKDRYSNIKFLIIGDVFNKEKIFFEKESEALQITDVIEKTGWLPYEEVGEVIAKCSIGIIFMDMDYSENISFSSPNKLFNYMMYGLPIVTTDLPEIRRIVLESKCGLIVEKRSVDYLADAISVLIDQKELRKKLGENGRKAAYEKYNWGMMEKKLLRVYDELLSSSKYIMQND